MRLHLAPGSNWLPGWVHIDIRPEVEPDIVADVAELPMYRDNTIEAIYACHLLDHFSLAKTYDVLKEWSRVLKPHRGILWLSVPDFEVVAKCYVNKGVHLERLRGMIYGGQSYEENFHYTAWDYETLACQLRQCNFYDVERIYKFPFRCITEYNDFFNIKLDGTPCGLNVKAVAK